MSLFNKKSFLDGDISGLFVHANIISDILDPLTGADDAATALRDASATSARVLQEGSEQATDVLGETYGDATSYLQPTVQGGDTAYNQYLINMGLPPVDTSRGGDTPYIYQKPTAVEANQTLVHIQQPSGSSTPVNVPHAFQTIAGADAGEVTYTRNANGTITFKRGEESITTDVYGNTADAGAPSETTPRQQLTPNLAPTYDEYGAEAGRR